METLVVAQVQHRNQCYGGVKRYGYGFGHARYGSSPPSKQFREINCRSFQSAAGILPTPSKARRSPPPMGKSSTPKTTSPTFKGSARSLSGSDSRHGSGCLNFDDTSDGKALKKEASFDGELANWKNFQFSELWAGPAYSNSPPPSSLPIPKFSVKPKRTVSLNLPVTDSGLEIPPTAKSAPASPTREQNSSTDPFVTADSATQTLRRILNLDMADE